MLLENLSCTFRRRPGSQQARRSRMRLSSRDSSSPLVSQLSHAETLPRHCYYLLKDVVGINYPYKSISFQLPYNLFELFVFYVAQGSQFEKRHRPIGIDKGS